MRRWPGVRPVLGAALAGQNSLDVAMAVTRYQLDRLLPRALKSLIRSSVPLFCQTLVVL
jgi:hypothetical protein